MVTFVASNASSSEEALKNATISTAEGKAVGAVAVRAIPVPVGTDEDIVAYSQDARAGGDVVLRPSQVLEVGEYAIAFIPTDTSGAGLRVWDPNFSVTGFLDFP